MKRGKPLQRKTGLRSTSLLNSTMPHDVEERPAKKAKPALRRHRRRDWTYARGKVDDEGVCRVCGDAQVDSAHVIGRDKDRRVHAPGKPDEWWFEVDADSVVPLCRAHHVAYDAHELDLLPYLSQAEQLRAVEDAGGLELARMRTCPSEYREAA